VNSLRHEKEIIAIVKYYKVEGWEAQTKMTGRYRECFARDEIENVRQKTDNREG
jgi:hypothetical protein